MAQFEKVFLYLMIYSFIGWCCEVLFKFIARHKWVNTGFLHGPICPIYGFGAILIIGLLEPLRAWPPLVFLVGMAACSALEYITSVLMERMFHMRWWDYSKHKFNLHGRIWLFTSTLFGVGGLVILYGVHPLIARLVGMLDRSWMSWLSALFGGLLALDLLSTVANLLHVGEHLTQLAALIRTQAEDSQVAQWLKQHDLRAAINHLSENGSEEFKARLTQSLHENKTTARLLKAFPNLTFTDAKEDVLEAQQALREAPGHLWDRTKAWGRRNFPKQMEAIEKYQEKQEWEEIVQTAQGKKSFAQGYNYYKYFWIFMIAAILGFLLETAFCLVTRGYVESRQSMLYGPMNAVYGFGAVLMVMFLRRLQGGRDIYIFGLSAIIGGAFEYVCSFLQEKVLGSISWEYSEHAFSIGGRTSLTFMLMWGVLGVLLVKDILPRLNRIIEQIPNRLGKLLTWVLTVLTVVNMALSLAAVYRWSERSKDIPPENAAARFLDNTYDDEYMQRVYPNMTFLHLRDSPNLEAPK